MCILDVFFALVSQKTCCGNKISHNVQIDHCASFACSVSPLASSGDYSDVAKKQNNVAMFASLHVQAFITSGTELSVNALFSLSECASFCRSCAVFVSKLDACFALCSVDLFIYISSASEVSCVDSTDACVVNNSRLRLYYVVIFLSFF